jgi:predicted deacylase
MRTYTLGDGPPEVAVVGAVHGDEPCGERAVERLVAADPSVERPVKLIVANEAALDAGVRYLDADLNRIFGDEEGDGHEHRLASALADEIRGLTTLSLHSTHSYPEPVAAVNGLEGVAAHVAPRLPVDAVLDIENDLEGRLFELEATPLVEVECGLQGSDTAADNAERVVRAFLGATGALPPMPEGRSRPVFLMGEPVGKPPAERYEVHAENFRRVERGETFARADDRRFVADEPFYPLLFSAEGYEDIWGYVGDRAGELQPAGSVAGGD